jgi:lysophospholipase L1-like esterase
VVLTAACGDGVVTPSTLAPIIVCPMPVTAQSVGGSAVAVTYEPPQVVAGETPLRIRCSPESGTLFQVGTTTVTCTVTDAVGRSNLCTFAVTVALAPRLSMTKFLAFGNSITEGKNAYSVVLTNNYPAVLGTMLRQRYTTQTDIDVVNRGKGGETAVDGSDRIEVELDALRPEVLLLEEGVNDLLGGDPLKVDVVIDALRDSVRKAKARGVRVLLATLVPGRPGQSRSGAVTLISPTNQRIRQLALSEGVTLVDLYAGFGGSPDPYIDVDGLHPNELGYQKMAEIFFGVIRATFELPSGPGSLDAVARLFPALTAPYSRFP